MARLLLLPLAATASVMDSATFMNEQGRPHPMLEATNLVRSVQLHEGVYLHTVDLAASELGEPLDYKHMSKCAGTYISRLVANMSIGNRHSANTNEQHPLGPGRTEKHFTIASVRNPCDYYVSLWSYNNLGQWHHNSRWGDLSKPFMLLGKHPTMHAPIFQKALTAKDIAAGKVYENHTLFASYMNMTWAEGSSHGIMTYRFWETLVHLSTHGLRCWAEQLFTCSNWFAKFHSDAACEQEVQEFDFANLVDCWVYTESVEEDLHRCLKTYEAVTGVKLNWDKWDQRQPDANVAPHAKCNDMYHGSKADGQLGKLIMKRDSALASKFGYDRCCGPPNPRKRLWGKSITPTA